MTPRQFTHLAAQRVLWSRPGRQLVRMVERVAPGWNYAVMNRSLDMRVNGEQWLASLLPADALVLDVGFNKGEFSTMVVQRRPKARCIGFEPAVSMQRLFEDCYPFKAQVELVAAAVSSCTGECLFSDSADGISKVLTECPETPARGPQCYTVTQTTLDSFAASRGISTVDFLKIDAEGFDLHVLEGAQGLLADQRISMFMFEYNAPWISTRRFLQEAAVFIDKLPYTLYRLFNGFLVPFRYSHRAERHDLGCNYVGLSHERLQTGDIRVCEFP